MEVPHSDVLSVRTYCMECRQLRASVCCTFGVHCSGHTGGLPPSPWLSSGGAPEPGISAPLPGCLGSGFPLAWDFLRLFLPNPFSLLLSCPRCETCAMSKGLPQLLLLPLPFTYLREFPATKLLLFWLHHSICFLENPKLYQRFLTIPLFICTSCTPVQPRRFLSVSSHYPEFELQSSIWPNICLHVQLRLTPPPIKMSTL